MKQAQPLGQRMDQARARFRRAVESGEKAAEGTGEFRASAAGGDASPDGREHGQKHGSFDRDRRNFLEPQTQGNHQSS